MDLHGNRNSFGCERCLRFNKWCFAHVVLSLFSERIIKDQDHLRPAIVYIIQHTPCATVKPATKRTVHNSAAITYVWLCCKYTVHLCRRHYVRAEEGLEEAEPEAKEEQWDLPDLWKWRSNFSMVVSFLIAKISEFFSVTSHPMVFCKTIWSRVVCWFFTNALEGWLQQIVGFQPFSTFKMDSSTGWCFFCVLFIRLVMFHPFWEINHPFWR